MYLIILKDPIPEIDENGLINFSPFILQSSLPEKTERWVKTETGCMIPTENITAIIPLTETQFKIFHTQYGTQAINKR